MDGTVEELKYVIKKMIVIEERSRVSVNEVHKKIEDSENQRKVAVQNDKGNIKKEDIGLPINFQHISHIGRDPNHGFDLEGVPPILKIFFHKAGGDERALQDTDTRDFISDFIDKHGGVHMCGGRPARGEV